MLTYFSKFCFLKKHQTDLVCKSIINEMVDQVQLEDEASIEEYELVKRRPPKNSRSKNDVYISQRSSFKAQLQKVKKLFESGQTEVVLHGLGAAIERVVSLALKLEEEAQPLLKLAVTHDSMQVVDELKCVSEAGSSKTQCRKTPVIHIKIFKTDSIPFASPDNPKKHPLVKQRKKKQNSKPY